MKAINYILDLNFRWTQTNLTIEEFAKYHGLNPIDMNNLLIIAQSKEVLTAYKNMINDHFFKDEDDNWISGHPDQLAIDKKVVLKFFPDCPFKTIKETRRGNGYVLSDGVYLFPHKDYFLEIVTED